MRWRVLKYFWGGSLAWVPQRLHCRYPTVGCRGLQEGRAEGPAEFGCSWTTQYQGELMLQVLILDISLPFWVLEVFSGAGFKIREEFFLSDCF